MTNRMAIDDESGRHQSFAIMLAQPHFCTSSEYTANLIKSRALYDKITIRILNPAIAVCRDTQEGSSSGLAVVESPFLTYQNTAISYRGDARVDHWYPVSMK